MNAPNTSMYMYDCGTKPVYTWIKSLLKLKFNALWFLQDFFELFMLEKYRFEEIFSEIRMLFQKKFHPIMPWYKK